MNYSSIYETYGKKLSEKIPELIFVSKKWSDNDLKWPFSDLDFRLILKDGFLDFYSINEKAFLIQKKMVKKNSGILGRILEHPPGYIFKYSELLTNYLEDINNWSFCYGDKKRFESIKMSNCNKKSFDYTYYINILRKRYKRFSFITEYKFDDKVLNKCYQVYCILWHYYYPCIYALNSLQNHLPQEYKILDFYHPKQKIIMSAYKDIVSNNHESLYKYNLDDLIICVDNEIEQYVSKLNVDIKMDSVTKDNYFEAIAMLRTRIARYLLYLDDLPNSDKGYLIEREINELRFIFSEIYKEQKNSVIKKIYDYICGDKDPADILRFTIKYLYENKDYFNELMNINKEDYNEV